VEEKVVFQQTGWVFEDRGTVLSTVEGREVNTGERGHAVLKKAEP